MEDKPKKTVFRINSEVVLPDGSVGKVTNLKHDLYGYTTYFVNGIYYYKDVLKRYVKEKPIQTEQLNSSGKFTLKKRYSEQSEDEHPSTCDIDDKEDPRYKMDPGPSNDDSYNESILKIDLIEKVTLKGELTGITYTLDTDQEDMDIDFPGYESAVALNEYTLNNFVKEIQEVIKFAKKNGMLFKE